MWVARASYAEADKVVASLSRLRLTPVDYESQIYEEMEKVLNEDGILYEREVKIGLRMRVDFLCGRVGIEVKKGKPNRSNVMKQVVRYCESDKIDVLVLVIERSLFGHLTESNGKKVYYLALNKLWGLAV